MTETIRATSRRPRAPKPPVAAPDAPASFDRKLVADYRGGRETQPTNYNPFGQMPYDFIPRRGAVGIDLTQSSPSDFAPWILLGILADNQADVSLALWNILRLGATGFTWSVKNAAGDDDPKGMLMTTANVARLNPKGGGASAICIQLMLSAYLYGACAAELALTENLRDMEDIYPANPWTFYFTRDERQNLILWQQQLYPGGAGYNTGTAFNTGAAVPGQPDGNFPYRRMNPLLVRYTPIDPMIDDPYGRMPAAPAINEWAFDVNLIADLQKAVHGVAVPRYWLKIVEEVLVKSKPSKLLVGSKEYAEWLDKRLDDVQAAFQKLPADAAFAAYDSVTLDTVGVKTGSNILTLINPLMRVIERRMIKSLKMLPILMASNEGTTETHGSVQFEIFAQGIHAMQDAAMGIMSSLLELAMQVQGYSAKVTCSFKKVNTANRLTDASSKNREITNAALLEGLGYQSHDESSIEVTGSPAFGPPATEVLAGLTPTLAPTPANVESGARMMAKHMLHQRILAEVHTAMKNGENYDRAWADAISQFAGEIKEVYGDSAE